MSDTVTSSRHEEILAVALEMPSGLTPYAAATALLALLDGTQQQWLLDREQTDHPEIMRAVLTVLFGTDTE
ncbi:hypothetical protein OG874_44350 [Nocardia sp. NBC_00565]|uniref:hypothetical protein n=1 Tax=Nocardia sp. NBC_00565 TaxID=2975993 RepID=UPI002E80DFC1|nr:hypothetical protein [Nocardia sp. NBC_00565]WUC03595.1 hypothetical protein OG874_44350 [Nocardia sp. NBC_00565]